MVKVVLSPTSLVTEIRPPNLSIIPRQMARPQAGPLALRFVEKNGVKILFRFSSDIPLPVSVTAISTESFSLDLVVTVIVPSFSTAWVALISRLSTTWRSRGGSLYNIGKSGSNKVVTLMFFVAASRSISATRFLDQVIYIRTLNHRLHLAC